MKTINCNTMNRIRKTIDLHGATAHIMHHGYLTYLAGTGTDSKTIQTIAGHSTIAMTMDHFYDVWKTIRLFPIPFHHACLLSIDCAKYCIPFMGRHIENPYGNASVPPI